MARLVFAMNVSLDGYVDHERFAPDPTLFRHWIDQVRASAGSLYGRRLYEIMAYWDEDQAEWGDAEREFAAAWRDQPKWVASRTLTSVGPSATLISEDLQAEVRRLKADLSGDIDLGGPVLAAALADQIDEYRLYYHPVVLGSGRPLFTSARSGLRLVSSDRVGEKAVCLTYVPPRDDRALTE